MNTSFFKLMIGVIVCTAFAWGQGSQLPKYTVSTLPSTSSQPKYIVQVIDGVAYNDCAIGGGGFNVMCTPANGVWLAVNYNGYNMVSVTEYGAKCDGSTDDLAAFNAAYAAVQAINEKSANILSTGWGGQAYLTAPAGVSCALSSTAVWAQGGVYMPGTRLVPIPITADYALYQDGNKLGQGPQWNPATCLAAGDGGCEPSRNLHDWLPSVYRQKAGPGWADTTHCGGEIVSVQDSYFWADEVDGFQRAVCIEDAYGTGTSDITVYLGRMENDQIGVQEIPLDQYSYVNSITTYGGDFIADSSNGAAPPFTSALPRKAFYGTLINNKTWLGNTSLPLPNVVTNVAANGDGSGGFPATITPAVMAAKPLLLCGTVAPPMITIPDFAYVSDYCNGGLNYEGRSCSTSPSVTLSYDFPGTITSGSNEITGVYDTGFTGNSQAKTILVGETPNTIYIVPNIPPYVLGTSSTYTTITANSGSCTSGCTATMSVNAQGTASNVHFTFYAGPTSIIIASAVGSLTAGSPTITFAGASSFSVGSITSLVNGTTIVGGGYVIPIGNVIAPISTNGVMLQTASTVSGSYSCYFENQSFHNLTWKNSGGTYQADYPCTLTSGSTSVTLTGTPYTGSGNINAGISGPTVTGLESTITGTGIPSGAHVLFVESPFQFDICTGTPCLPANATASGTVTLTAPAYSNLNSTDLGAIYTTTPLYWPMAGTIAFDAEIYPSGVSYPLNANHVVGLDVEGAQQELYCKVRVVGANVIFDYLRWESDYGGRACLVDYYVPSGAGQRIQPTFRVVFNQGFELEQLQVAAGPFSYNWQICSTNGCLKNGGGLGEVLSNSNGDGQPILTLKTGQVQLNDQYSSAFSWMFTSNDFLAQITTDSTPRFDFNPYAKAMYFSDGTTAINKNTSTNIAWSNNNGQYGTPDIYLGNANLGFAAQYGTQTPDGWNIGKMMFFNPSTGNFNYVWYSPASNAWEYNSGIPTASGNITSLTIATYSGSCSPIPAPCDLATVTAANSFTPGSSIEFIGPLGQTLAISGFTGSSGTLTFTTTTQSPALTSGALVTLTGFTGGNSSLNGQVVTLLSSGLTTTQFEAIVTGSGYSTGAGELITIGTQLVGKTGLVVTAGLSTTQFEVLIPAVTTTGTESESNGYAVTATPVSAASIALPKSAPSLATNSLSQITAAPNTRGCAAGYDYYGCPLSSTYLPTFTFTTGTYNSGVITLPVNSSSNYFSGSLYRITSTICTGTTGSATSAILYIYPTNGSNVITTGSNNLASNICQTAVILTAPTSNATNAYEVFVVPSPNPITSGATYTLSTEVEMVK